ncbi:MAG: AmmeMemoRadiSam system protein A [Syntrophomonadaceae bacterium]|nr:AmmeMemoRadiSam system protein A [Syntrophomonadaceae bacterium]
MPIIAACIVPHPPLAIPAVGRGQELEIMDTVRALKEVARRIGELEPDTVIFISPHAVAYADYIHLAPGDSASGDMSRFGAPGCRFKVNYDAELCAVVAAAAKAIDFPAGTLGQREPELDHGCTVPLYYISPALSSDCRVLRVSVSGLSAGEHYRCGMLLAESVEKLGRRAVVVASGDLSHRLKAKGPYGFDPAGPEFDRAVTAAMGAGDFLSFLTLDTQLCNDAGECGLRSFQIMAGAFDGRAVRSELLSYEGPFGVGYGVAWFKPAAPDSQRLLLERLQERNREALAATRAGEDALVRLARQSLEYYVQTGKAMPLPEGLPEEFLKQRAGAFVSLKKHGQLRGCIGTTAPTRDTLAQEVIANAISAGARDPRFASVGPNELDEIVYSVDVLSAAEPVSGPEALDPQRYGVIVTSGRRRGLLLPMLEGVDTVESQLAIACDKAGIGPHEKYSIERFEVVRHK